MARADLSVNRKTTLENKTALIDRLYVRALKAKAERLAAQLGFGQGAYRFAIA